MIKKIDIIAPASSMPLDDFELCLKELELYGIPFHYDPAILKPDIYFAGPLKSQTEQFLDAMNSDADVIWCVRGGYGSMRLVPHLETLPIPKTKKTLIGFSDITSLHIFLNQKWGWETIHGPTISQFKNVSLKESIQETFEILTNSDYHPLFENLIPLNDAAKVNREIRAKVCGGNLRIIQSSLKTDWELDTSKKIVIMEDVGERGYSVDRMLEQLVQSKTLNEKTAAIIFGDFTESLEKNGNDLVPTALDRFAKATNIPVLKGLPSGHHHERNRPVIFNREAKLDLEKLNLRF